MYLGSRDPETPYRRNNLICMQIQAKNRGGRAKTANGLSEYTLSIRATSGGSGELHIIKGSRLRGVQAL